ncbi:MAG: PH domain-containing protein [Clostridia bacterium]|nr:PH domain-containing protein [Clostridia bacterium]
MELKKLDKAVLKLWYVRAGIVALMLIGVFVAAAIILSIAGASNEVTLAVLLGVGIPVALLLSLVLIWPVLRYRMFSWGYDDKRIVVKEGVIFRKSVVIPICQIQDLHRTQGPIMIILGLSDVTISTAGSNFDLSTLTVEDADRMINELEESLEARIEEQGREEI